jgi:plasmid maintenance system killer protein
VLIDVALNQKFFMTQDIRWKRRLSNHLKALKTLNDAINDRWRVCFRFEPGNAQEVEIVDYC